MTLLQVLLYGSGAAKRAEAEQRVIFELQPHLSAAGTLGKPAAVAETLKSLLYGALSENQMPDIPAGNPSNAYLLAVAALETARAECGPLKDDENTPTPLMHALAYEAAAQPKTIEHAVFSALSQASFRQTADRLLCKTASANNVVSARSLSPELPAPLEPRAFAKLERLATTLITSVAFKGDKGTAVDAPATSTRAAPLLEQLLHACPSLLVSERCLRSWLEQENSPEVRGQVQSWVARGSKLAPTRVEHLLHHYLISGAAGDGKHAPGVASGGVLAHSAGLLDVVEISRQSSLLGDVATGASTHVFPPAR